MIKAWFEDMKHGIWVKGKKFNVYYNIYNH